jgi:hypothetical protein
MINGDMWESGIKKRKSNYNVAFSAGSHNIFFSRKINNSKSYVMLRADLDYGNQFAVSKHNDPFDYFTLTADVNITSGDNIVAIFASGVIWDTVLELSENSTNIIGVYKEIDVHINTIYKLSATSVTGQYLNSIPLTSSISLQNHLGVSTILMGGTNSEYASEVSKDYNIGPGASAKIGTKITLGDFTRLYINYKRFWIHTLSGADGEEFVGLFNMGASFQLLENNLLGLELILYERFGEYKNFPNTRDSNSALRLFIKHQL